MTPPTDWPAFDRELAATWLFHTARPLRAFRGTRGAPCSCCDRWTPVPMFADFAPKEPLCWECLDWAFAAGL